MSCKEEDMAIRTPLKAIRAKCLDCTNGQNREIRECPIEKILAPKITKMRKLSRKIFKVV